MKFENASIKNLESVEEYVEKLMLSGKIFQKEYVEEHIFIQCVVKPLALAMGI